MHWFKCRKHPFGLNAVHSESWIAVGYTTTFFIVLAWPSIAEGYFHNSFFYSLGFVDIHLWMLLCHRNNKYFQIHGAVNAQWVYKPLIAFRIARMFIFLLLIHTLALANFILQDAFYRETTRLWLWFEELYVSHLMHRDVTLFFVFFCLSIKHCAKR